MRRTLSLRLIVILALWGLLPAVASAQATATASNTVTVRIPTVLRMQLTPGNASASGNVSFSRTADGRLDPGSVTVKIFSNVDWTLTVKDTGAGTGPLLQVDGHDATTWRTVTGVDQQIAHGAATGGWASYAFDFQPENEAALPSDFNRTLTFTLAKP